MTLIGEAVLVVTMACTGNRRQQSGCNAVPLTFVSDTSTGFQVCSGSTLEDEVRNELLDIEGVMSVDITPNGDRFQVRVELRELDFDLYSKVAQKELDLFDQFQAIKYRFDIVEA